MNNIKASALICLLAVTTFNASQSSPYGCKFTVSVNMANDGTAITPPHKASILCVNGINHDPDSLLANGFAMPGNASFGYCDNDSLIIAYDYATTANRTVGCVHGSGPYANSPGSSKQFEIPAGSLSETILLRAGCEATGSKVDAICASLSKMPAPPD